MVNLLYVDHCLAHYYLALCSNNPQTQHYNFLAIKHLLGSNKLVDVQISEKEFIQNLPKYQELYENSQKYVSLQHTGKIISEETREKERVAHLGKKYKPMSEQGRLNISESHKGKKRGPRSEVVCQKISETRKNHQFKRINNGVETKFVPLAELNTWIAEGWKLGYGYATKYSQGRIWVIKGQEMKSIKSEELEDYIAAGWRRGRIPHSEEAR